MAVVSFIDVGKDAKRNGATHPKNVPTPTDRVTPKKGKKHKRKKLYGYRFEHGFQYPDRKSIKWTVNRRWFASEAGRDHSYAKELAHQLLNQDGRIFKYRNLHKMER